MLGIRNFFKLVLTSEDILEMLGGLVYYELPSNQIYLIKYIFKKFVKS